MSLPTLKKHYVVVKHNKLNEIRPNEMGLQELRLFSIYLSKINPNDESTRRISFLLEDFRAIMDLRKINFLHLKDVIDGLLCKVAELPLESGGFTRFVIFKECKMDKKENGDWYVEIDANDIALPMMFNLKGHYFKYKLWNALHLKSTNQLRMYEILKQYEHIGHRVITVNELRGLLGIEEHEYSRFTNFKNRVLDGCQQALSNYSDISFTWEPHGKKGKGGKINEIKFTITKNKNYRDPLLLEKFIDLKSENIIDAIDAIDETEELFDETEPEDDIPGYNERITFLMDACDNVFNGDEMMEINILLAERMPHISGDDMKAYQYLARKYMEMQRYDKIDDGIKHKFKYFKKLIGTE